MGWSDEGRSRGRRKGWSLELNPVFGGHVAVRGDGRWGTTSEDLTVHRLRIWTMFALQFAVPVCWAGQRDGLSGEIQTAVRTNLQSYRDAWLKGDNDAVMATLTEDAVLLPSGHLPVVGGQAIRAFWWPASSPPAKIIAMDLEIEAIHGNEQLAYARGRGSLSFSYRDNNRDTTVSSRFTFLNVLKRGADGGWRTSCRMWTDLRQ